MKKYLLAAISLLWVLTACSSVGTPVLNSPTEILSTQTPAPPIFKYYPLDTITGIEELDVILAAVAKNDPEDLIRLFSYTKTACKTVKALGGPPPCRDGEAEGTIVEVLPFLGPEGSYLRKDEINNFQGLNVDGLYAVYQVSDSAYSEEFFPAGDYGIVLTANGNMSDVILQIKDGKITRIDYVFDPSALPVILQRDAAYMVIEPLK